MNRKKPPRPGRWTSPGLAPTRLEPTRDRPRLGDYARGHLARKRALREASPRWLACVERHLT